MRRRLLLIVFFTALINLACAYYWREYYRTLGNPIRWDKPTYAEWDCFYNECADINGGKTIP